MNSEIGMDLFFEFCYEVLFVNNFISYLRFDFITCEIESNVNLLTNLSFYFF
jgi:hypothetical protein